MELLFRDLGLGRADPPPLNRDYSRDPNTKALKWRGCIHQGST